MKIAVGSTNPVKINAVINAASEQWPDVKVEGFSVASNVNEQPRSDQETRLGAINRAKATLSDQEFDLGIGLEGGVFTADDGKLWSTVWVAVVDTQDNVFVANGARFEVPDIIAEKIKAGEEMGPVVASIVGEADVRSKQGMIGVITNNFVDRTEEYSGIVKMALGLWFGRDWNVFDR